MNTKRLLLGILAGLILLASAGQVMASGAEMRQVYASAVADVSALADVSSAADVSCDSSLNEILSQPNWDKQLVNPVLHSVKEVRARANLYQRIESCLKTGQVPVTSEASAVLNQWISYFLTMAGSQVMQNGTASVGKGYMVPFAQVSDPAVLALRNEMHLPEPDGYVFVRLYPSVQVMPDVLKPFFKEPDVQGVTFAPRYIVALDPVQPGSNLEKSQREWRSKVLSHELVHAYIRASLWPIDMEKLPTWYTEGVAIYFSDTANPFVYYDNQGRALGVQPPDEMYFRYRNDFLYLEKQYGRQELVARIKQSLEAVDTKPLLSGINIKSEDELYARYEAWGRGQRLTRLAMTVGTILGFILLVVLVVRLQRWLSERSPYQPEPAYSIQPPVQSPPRYTAVPRRESPPARSNGSMHPTAPPVQTTQPMLTALLNMLHAPEPEARSAAAEGLSQWAAANLGSRTVSEDRTRIVQALLPLLVRDPSEPVRRAVFATLFWVGGARVLRPLMAAVRGGSAEFQRWFVDWAAGSDQMGMVIDMASWLQPEVRQAAVDILRRRMTPALAERLSALRESGDASLRALAEEVLGEE